MWETAVICAAALLMAALYSRTEHPKLYAFLNMTAGALSLVLTEIVFDGGTAGITPYNAALSVILGVPGTVVHRLIEMM